MCMCVCVCVVGYVLYTLYIFIYAVQHFPQSISGEFSVTLAVVHGCPRTVHKAKVVF